MNASNKNLTQKLFCLGFGAALYSLNPAFAETDMQLQEKALKARERQHAGAMDHSAHTQADPAMGKFRGVFYGYLPCSDPECSGIKMTLSLNVKNRYLLVIQPAKAQNRESFEKGKYQWDESKGVLLLTPNKEGEPPRRLSIKDEGSLLYVNADGSAMPGDQDRYFLKRSDQAGNREMHIH